MKKKIYLNFDKQIFLVQYKPSNIYTCAEDKVFCIYWEQKYENISEHASICLIKNIFRMYNQTKDSLKIK